MKQLNVMVTGGLGTLGLRMMHHLKRSGHRIIILDNAMAPSTDAPLCEPEAEIHAVDLTNTGCLRSTLDEVIQRHRHIDILINNAALRLRKPLISFTDEEIESAVKLSFLVPVWLTKHLLPVMIGNGYGRVINISSRQAFGGGEGASVYNSTKAALNAFTLAVARECSSGCGNVTINAICPGRFTDDHGHQSKDHDEIVDRILRTIDDLLDSNKNGELIRIYPFRKRLKEFFKK